MTPARMTPLMTPSPTTKPTDRDPMAKEILIVDDEADIRLMLSGILEDEGYAVRQAANSDEAFEAVGERVPALVVLDIWMTGSRSTG